MKKIPLICILSSCLFLPSIDSVSAAEFGLFGDVIYSQSDAAEENGAFGLGALDFYAAARLNDNTEVFIEYVFEETQDGLITDLERLWIKRFFSDRFELGAGRFHTPLGTWNRTYHHGAFLQDTVSRPFFLEFEDGASAVLPTHIVGLLSSGTFILDKGEFSYEAYIANGSSLDSSKAKPEIEINTNADPNQDKTLGFRLTYGFDELPLQLGLMFMDNAIAESAEGNSGNWGIAFGETLIEQQITGFDIKSETENFYFLLEYYNLNNDSKVGNIEKHTGYAYYAQLGYKINPTNRLIYRYADLSVDDNDDYFLILNIKNQTRNVIAYRYDLDDSNSLKFELNHSTPDNGSDITTGTLQWSFLVP